MIPIEEYAKSKNLTTDQVMEGIKAGIYDSEYRGGQLLVASKTAEPIPQATTKPVKQRLDKTTKLIFGGIGVLLVLFILLVILIMSSGGDSKKKPTPSRESNTTEKVKASVFGGVTKNDVAEACAIIAASRNFESTKRLEVIHELDKKASKAPTSAAVFEMMLATMQLQSSMGSSFEYTTCPIKLYGHYDVINPQELSRMEADASQSRENARQEERARREEAARQERLAAEREAEREAERKIVPQANWRAAIVEDLKPESFPEVVSAEVEYYSERETLHFKVPCAFIDGYRFSMHLTLAINDGSTLSESGLASRYCSGYWTGEYWGLTDEILNFLDGLPYEPPSYYLDSRKLNAADVFESVYINIVGVSDLEPASRNRRLEGSNFPPLTDYSELDDPIRWDFTFE